MVTILPMSSSFSELINMHECGGGLQDSLAIALKSYFVQGLRIVLCPQGTRQ